MRPEGADPAGRPARWYDGFGPVALPVRCGGDDHRISLRRGRVVLEDHGLTGERALAALGTKPWPCMALLAAWPALAACGGDLLTHLVPDDRGGASPAWLPPAWLTEAEWVARPAGAAKGSFRPGEASWARTLLGGLPPPALAVAARAAVMATERRWDEQPESAQRPFVAALQGHFRRAVVLVTDGWWSGVLGPPVDCAVAARGETPSVAGHLSFLGGGAAVRLPLSWLVTVWSRGLAVVDGFLVLEARGGPDVVDVEAVRWQSRRPLSAEAVVAPAVARRDADGRWRLRWR